MVEVEDHGDCTAKFPGILDSALGHVSEEGLIGVLARAARHLEDDWGFGLNAGTDNCLHLLHVVEIEGRNGVSALHRLLKQFVRIY